jgi:hypothetical protein
MCAKVKYVIIILLNNSYWKKTKCHFTFYTYDVNYLDIVVAMLLFTNW